MSNDISIAKENIYSFPSQFDFFKQNDLQSACYKLTCDIEEIFLGVVFRKEYSETYSILLSSESPNTTSRTVKHLINSFTFNFFI